MRKLFLVMSLALLLVGLMVAPAFAGWDYKVNGGAYALSNGGNFNFGVNIIAMSDGDTTKGMAKYYIYDSDDNITQWFQGDIKCVKVNYASGEMTDEAYAVVVAEDLDRANGSTWDRVRIRLYDDGEGDGTIDRVQVGKYSENLNPTGLDMSLAELCTFSGGPGPSNDVDSHYGTVLEGNIQVH